MKKILLLLCTVLLLFSWGCGRNSFTLEYTIPPGDGSDFYFSDQQISQAWADHPCCRRGFFFRHRPAD